MDNSKESLDNKALEEKSCPKRKRSCSNLLSFVVFVAVLGAFVVISGYSFKTCSPARFYNGIDSWGNVCGGDSSMLTQIPNLAGSNVLKAENTMLWHVNLLSYDIKTLSNHSEACKLAVNSFNDSMSCRVCIDQCPSNSVSNLTDYRSLLTSNGYDQRYILLERLYQKLGDIESSCSTDQKWLANSSFTSIFGRCLPKRYLKTGYYTTNSLTVWHYAADDLLKSAGFIALSIIVVMSLCVLVSISFIKFPKSSCRAFYVITAISTILCSLVMFWKSLQTSSFGRKDLFMLRIFCAVLSCIAALAICANFCLHMRHFRPATGLMAEVAKCLKNLPKLISQPLWTLLVLSNCLLYFITALLYMINCNSLKASEDGLRAVYGTTSSPVSNWTILLVGTLVYLWLANMLKASQQIVVSGAVAEWYFAKNRRALVHPITSSLRHLVRYNLGSAMACAFNGGLQHSVIQACCKSNKVGNESTQNEQEVSLSFGDLFSPFAPISVGVYGRIRPTCLCANIRLPSTTNFALHANFNTQQTRSSHAFRLQNQSIVDVIRYSAATAKWCCRACHVAIVCVSIVVFIETTATSDLHVRTFLLLVVLVSGYSVAGICIGVMITSIDTVAVCLWEDVARNNGVTSPLYASRELMYHVSGIRLPESATFTSILRRDRKQEHMERRAKMEGEKRRHEMETLDRIRSNPRNIKELRRKADALKNLSLKRSSISRRTSIKRIAFYDVQEENAPRMSKRASEQLGAEEAITTSHKVEVPGSSSFVQAPLKKWRKINKIVPLFAGSKKPLLIRTAPDVTPEVGSDEEDDEKYGKKIFDEGFW